jgi:hypothetical protein
VHLSRPFSLTPLNQDPSPSPATKVATKRELSTTNTSLSPSSKKARVEETKKPSLSSLLKKVNPSSSGIPIKQEGGGARSLDSKDGLVAAADSSNAAKTGDSAKGGT